MLGVEGDFTNDVGCRLLTVNGRCALSVDQWGAVGIAAAKPRSKRGEHVVELSTQLPFAALPAVHQRHIAGPKRDAIWPCRPFETGRQEHLF